MSDLLIANDTLGVVKLHALAQLLNELAHPSIVAIEHSHFTDVDGELELVPVNGVPLADAALNLESLIQAIASTAAALVHIHDHDVALVNVNAKTLMVRSDNSVVLTDFASAIEKATSTDKKHDVEQLAIVARTLIPEPDVLRERMNGDETSMSRASFIALLNEADKGLLDARLFAEKLRHSLWFDFKPAKTTAKRRRLPNIQNIPKFDFAGLSLRAIKRHRPTKRKVLLASAAALCGVIAILATQPESKPKPAADKVTPVISCELLSNATVDVDGDGCLDSVIIGDGVVTINTERYAVGTPGDRLIIGDWQCDGRPTLAMLQKATGTVYVFDEWPAAGAIAKPRKVTSVVGATEVDKHRQKTCDLFTVNGSSGIQDVNLRKA